MDTQDKKRELIIDAALQRFAHFGLNKTTMNEIAKDLKFSKALLYYYFPDKINLYAAVIQKIFSEMTSELNIELLKAKTPEIAITKLTDTKQEFLEKYYPIIDFSKLANNEKYKELKAAIDQANEDEINQIKQIIEIGINTGVYKIKDSRHYATLLFDVLQGIRILYFSNAQIQFGISKDSLQILSEKQKEIIKIYLKGLQD